MLGADIRQVWTAPAITDRDRKELLRTLLEEVIFNLDSSEKIMGNFWFGKLAK
jgi:hypothetical protein